MNIDWAAVSAIFTAIGSCWTALSLVILILTVVFIRREVQEIRNATYATTYKAAVDILQVEDIRSARRFVFTKLADMTFPGLVDIKEIEYTKQRGNND